MRRREFFARAAAGSAGLFAASRLAAQAGGTPQNPRGMVHDSMVVEKDSQNLFAMDQSAARSVKLPAKPNAAPSMTDKQRDDLEHRLHCQCGCTLDVYTCRTTDFSCQVSPAMHRDVVELVRGGYSAQEIIDAFTDVYGQRALMAPKKSGFNLIAWILPGAAVIGGGAVLVTLLRKWGERSRAPHPTPNWRPDSDATPEELAELEAAVRGEREE